MLVLSKKKKKKPLVITSRIRFDQVFRSWAYHIDIRSTIMLPAMGDATLCNLRTSQRSPL